MLQLKNAENRLEDAEFHRAPSMTPMSQDVHSSPPRRYVPDYSHDDLSDYSPQGSRVAVDMVPSLKIGTNKVRQNLEKAFVTNVDPRSQNLQPSLSWLAWGSSKGYSSLFMFKITVIRQVRMNCSLSMKIKRHKMLCICFSHVWAPAKTKIP